MLYPLHSESEIAIGRTFNLGLDDANLSKEELAETIKKYVPRFFIHYSEIGNRSGKAELPSWSNREELPEAGFEASRSVDVGGKELSSRGINAWGGAASRTYENLPLAPGVGALSSRLGEYEHGDPRLALPCASAFLGGGTDLPHYYEEHGGAVLSSTITRYASVTLYPRTDDSIQITETGRSASHKLNDHPRRW